jgi:hypothetical protein
LPENCHFTDLQSINAVPGSILRRCCKKATGQQCAAGRASASMRVDRGFAADTLATQVQGAASFARDFSGE